MSEPATYNITSVEDTAFDPDQYGNKFYSIQFEGWKGKVLWKTPNRPENNTQVYGSISPSKSGKAMIFKKEKKEDWRDGGQQSTAQTNPSSSNGVPGGSQESTAQQDSRATGTQPQSSRGDDIRWGLCTKEANAYVTKNRPDLAASEWAKEVNEYANALYSVAEKPKLEKDTEALKEFFGGEDYPQ